MFLKFYKTLKELTIINKLPNCFLIIEKNVDTGYKFAKLLSMWFLCINENKKKICKLCISCDLFLKTLHPDLFELIAEDKKKILLKDTIDLLVNIEKKSIVSNKKIIIIYKLNDMTENAVNCLLKTLEKNNTHNIFIIISHNYNILPTIYSRCYIICLYKQYNISYSNNTVICITNLLSTKKNNYQIIKKYIFTLKHKDKIMILDTLWMSIVYIIKKNIKNDVYGMDFDIYHNIQKTKYSQNLLQCINYILFIKMLIKRNVNPNIYYFVEYILFTLNKYAKL